MKYSTSTKRNQRAVQLLICISLFGTVHQSFAADVVTSAAPCNRSEGAAAAVDAVRAAAKAAALAQIAANTEAKKTAITAAYNCFQKIKQILDQLAIPGFPSLGKMAMDKILEFLANKACAVVITQVKVVTDPITGAISGVQNKIDGTVGQVNSATGGAIGVDVLKNGTATSTGVGTAVVGSNAAVKVGNTIDTTMAPVVSATDKIGTTVSGGIDSVNAAIPKVNPSSIWDRF